MCSIQDMLCQGPKLTKNQEKEGRWAGHDGVTFFECRTARNDAKLEALAGGKELKGGRGGDGAYPMANRPFEKKNAEKAVLTMEKAATIDSRRHEKSRGGRKARGFPFIEATGGTTAENAAEGVKARSTRSVRTGHREVSWAGKEKEKEGGKANEGNEGKYPTKRVWGFSWDVVAG